MKKSRMKALTLWPEWIPCFTHMDKRIENRSWPCPPNLIGTRMAFHAGKSIGGSGPKWDGLNWMAVTAEKAGWDIDFSESGETVGFRKMEVATSSIFKMKTVRIPTGKVVFTAVVKDCSKEDFFDSEWSMDGQYHWLLDELEVLDEPVKIGGHQGLWWWSVP